MKCSEIRELLSLYIDNMLEDSLTEEVAAHIEACPCCKKEYEELTAVTRMLAEFPEVKVPADFDKRLKAALEAEISGEKAESEYEPVRIAKKKLTRRISSVCAIFVVGIFALAMYNNIDRLIPKNDADNMMLTSQYNYAEDINGAVSDMSKDESIEGASESDSSGSAGSASADEGAGEMRFSGAYGGAAEPQEAYAHDMRKTSSAADGNTQSTDGTVQDMPEPQDVMPQTEGAADEIVPASSASESETPATRGLESMPPLTIPFKGGAGGTATQGAISDARDSVAIRYYMRALEKKLEGENFEILMCESHKDGLWSFDIDLVSTDEEGTEIHEYVTYYGQDGTLWREEAEE